MHGDKQVNVIQRDLENHTKTKVAMKELWMIGQGIVSAVMEVVGWKNDVAGTMWLPMKRATMLALMV